MATDSRTTEILTTYNELYQKKYGVPYPIEWGRDGKWAKKIAHYAIGFLEDDQVIPKLKDAMSRYLREETTFYAGDKHPFTKFCSSLQKWIVVQTRPQSPLPPPLTPCAKRTTEEVYQEFTEWAAEKPETAMVGFAQTGKRLKQSNPELYARIREFMLDLLGKKRASAIYRRVHQDTQNPFIKALS